MLRILKIQGKILIHRLINLCELVNLFIADGYYKY